MGIHFLCPNGHHLNVKKELAGKVGYCPKCRAKLIIPTVDEVSSNKRDSDADDAMGSKSSSHESRLHDAAPAALEPDANVALNDPAVLWHIRSLDGQSYGPAVGSIIKSWIEERRIGPKMLVWRQGWEKWEEAEKVFPEIRSVFEVNDNKNTNDSGTPDADALLRSSVARLVDSRVTNRADLASRKRKAVNSYRLILVLIGLIVVLLIALIAILFIR